MHWNRRGLSLCTSGGCDWMLDIPLMLTHVLVFATQNLCVVRPATYLKRETLKGGVSKMAQLKLGIISVIISHALQAQDSLRPQGQIQGQGQGPLAPGEMWLAIKMPQDSL